MKKLFLSFTIIFVFSFLYLNVSGQTFPFTKDSLLSRLKQLKEQTHVRSLMAGIWKGDNEILTVALGESMTSIPAATNMCFRIGGVSEIYLGTLLMILVDQGKIRLDDKISKWLPDFYDADKVTIEMLIKCTSGYKDYVLNKDFLELATKDPFHSFDREDIFKYAEVRSTVLFTPGTDQRYSHTNFTVLGDIIEKVTGKTMGELFKENILSKLPLELTGHSYTAELPCPTLHAFSSDRGVYEDATFWSPSWVGESGPFYSTLHDLGVWARSFGQGKLLTPAGFNNLIHCPAGLNTTEPLGNPKLYFAAGFVVANGWYAQNPSFNGFSGAFGYLPSKELTITVYTTESKGQPDSDKQAFEIFKELVKMITPEQTINF